MRKSLHKIGLKLWSDNLYYLEEIIRLQENQVFDYIELYSLPDTFDKYIDFWTKIKTCYVIHSPHFGHGVNLSDPDSEKQNCKYIKEACCFADKLNADMIIVHPGVGGSLDETIRQLVTYKDERLVVENKPYYGFTKDQICVGYHYENIKSILSATGLRFCLDIGHAIYAANVLKLDHMDFLKHFIELNPSIFHLTDGDINSVHDVHTGYGKGSFPIENIIKLLPKNPLITNEASKRSKTTLFDFEEDSIYLKQLFTKIYSE